MRVTVYVTYLNGTFGHEMDMDDLAHFNKWGDRVCWIDLDGSWRHGT